MTTSKKNKAVAFIAFISFFAYLPNGVALAAPGYGGSFPKKRGFESGLEYNYVFKRNMEKERGRMSSRQCFADISYGIADCLSLDLKVGLGDITLKNSNPSDMDFDASFAGGYGLRLKIPENNLDVDGIIGFQHISVHPRGINMQNAHRDAVLDDWQISALIYKKLKLIAPYIGAKVSEAYLIEWVDKVRTRTGSKNLVGLLLGMDIFLYENSRLNIDARLIDEYAISASLMTKF